MNLLRSTKFWFFISNTLILIIAADFTVFFSSRKSDFYQETACFSPSFEAYMQRRNSVEKNNTQQKVVLEITPPEEIKCVIFHSRNEHEVVAKEMGTVTKNDSEKPAARNEHEVVAKEMGTVTKKESSEKRYEAKKREAKRSNSEVSVAMAAAGTKVGYLPRVIQEQPLPFELETGYIGVGESEDIQLFYYFVKSESNPSDDPIVVWVSGGPGCSSFFAMTQEIGPLIMDLPKNVSVLPTFSLNPYSWTKVASFVYLDLPVGTGFSYAKSAKNYTSDTLEASNHGAEFIRKWLIEYPEYQSNSFYVGGDSYSGTLIPMFAQAISNGNDAMLKPAINFKGYLLGNGVTHFSEHDYTYQFALGYGLISEEFAEKLTFVNNAAYILDTSCLAKNGAEDVISGKAFVPSKRFNGVNANIFDRYLLCRCRFYNKGKSSGLLAS
nr:serine carboxypeptidase-like 11 isoform X2 [Ipomoea trifida]